MNANIIALLFIIFKDSMQENILDNYIQAALIPALHKNHHEHIGVFKPLANDTAKEKLLYLIIPGKSLKDVTTWSNDVMNDADYVQAAAAYINASYKNPPYVRMEKYFVVRFSGSAGNANATIEKTA